MSAAMPGNSEARPSRMTALVNWIDARFPMTRFIKEHASEYYAPKNFGCLGMQHPTPASANAARIFAFVYFAFFALMSWYTKIDQTKPVPERVTYHAH
jgi:quinol-cytochrome oxidoreductase complex cytochrome b subunit